MSTYYRNLLPQIQKKLARVGVVGIGYVGSAVVESCIAAGYTTIGFDVDPEKVQLMNKRKLKKLSATTDMSKLKQCDIICVCVPTPLREDHSPNLEFFSKAIQTIASYLQPGHLIIIESSVPPGTSRNVALPILHSTHLVPGRDFFFAYSPERIDPGNKRYTMKSIPKVVSGINEASKYIAAQFYANIVDEVVPVSSIEIAELTKVMENTFRLVNISLAHEMAHYAKKMGIDIWEVIAAAGTKPFGFLPHYPSAGAGGDCIPVLPHHLLYSAAMHGIDLPLIRTASEVNEKQAEHVVDKTIEALNGKYSHAHEDDEKPRVLLLGVAYKPESSDIRESPALRIWKLLEHKGVEVSYHDPFVSQVNDASSMDFTQEMLSTQDAIVITTPHQEVPYHMLLSSGRPVIDTTNTLASFVSPFIIRM